MSVGPPRPAPRGTPLCAISSEWMDPSWSRTHTRILQWCRSRDPALHRGRVDVVDVGQNERSHARALVLHVSLTLSSDQARSPVGTKDRGYSQEDLGPRGGGRGPKGAGGGHMDASTSWKFIQLYSFGTFSIYVILNRFTKKRPQTQACTVRKQRVPSR